jgi:hypothetical protein
MIEEIRAAVAQAEVDQLIALPAGCPLASVRFTHDAGGYSWVARRRSPDGSQFDADGTEVRPGYSVKTERVFKLRTLSGAKRNFLRRNGWLY